MDDVITSQLPLGIYKLLSPSNSSFFKVQPAARQPDFSSLPG